MNLRKKIILISIILITIACLLGFQIPQNKNLYTNKIYNISLEYKKSWKLNPNYAERYEGEDGFFQISASTGKDLTIDGIVHNEVTHMLTPYGSNPKIIKLTIQGQEARLVIPSSDQDKEFNNQAELIVKYPKEIKIDDDMYYYFILWADKDHIDEILKTLKFIN